MIIADVSVTKARTLHALEYWSIAQIEVMHELHMFLPFKTVKNLYVLLTGYGLWGYCSPTEWNKRWVSSPPTPPLWFVKPQCYKFRGIRVLKDCLSFLWLAWINLCIPETVKYLWLNRKCHPGCDVSGTPCSSSWQVFGFANLSLGVTSGLVFLNVCYMLSKSTKQN